VNALIEQLRSEGWDVLFADFVNSKRSGVGSQGALNFCLEKIFDQFPDIVAVRNNSLLIVEVDIAYKNTYMKKLKTFESKKDELFQCIKTKLGLNLRSLELGLSFVRTPSVQLGDFRLWVYNPRRKKFEELGRIH
jgi:hypothetical protein